MNIQLLRPQAEEALYQFVTQHTGLIVGDPGVGKSYSLKQLRERLVTEDTFVRLIRIDRVASTTLSEVLKEINFPENWVHEFRQSQQTATAKRGVLIFDSFDSLRNADTRKLWLEIIRKAVVHLASDVWKVVVSCRTYDAEKSITLKSIFEDNGYSSKPLIVKGLSQEELQGFLAKHPALSAAYNASSEQLKNLFTIPFYLVVIEELIRNGVQPDQFSAWHSAGQVLRAIFKHWLEHSNNPMQLVERLKELTQQQVKSMSLVTDWTTLHWSDEDANALSSVKIVEKGVEHTRSIRFAHNIFFDFAAAEYLIPIEPENFLPFIIEHPERQIFLRPSLQFYLSDIFSSKPDKFWLLTESTFLAVNKGLAPLSRVIMPSVAVSDAYANNQLQPLHQLHSTNPKIGEDLIVSVLRTLRMDISWLKSKNRRAIWLKFLAELGSNLKPTLTWEIGSILDQVWTALQEGGDAEQKQQCGQLARTILQWEWEQREKNKQSWNQGPAAIWAIPLVCQTYGQNTVMARKLLTKVLDILDEPNFAIECLYRLCDQTNVIPIIEADPDFAIEIYHRIFSLKDAGEGSITQGFIVPMSISRKDEFHMCHWNLTNAFPRFAQKHPIKAAKAAIKAAEGYAFIHHIDLARVNGDEPIENFQESFPFRGIKAHLLPDMSHIWDQSGHADDGQKLLHELDRLLQQLIESKQQDIMVMVLDLYAKHARYAVLWKHLIEVGIQHIETLGSLLFDLCVAAPILHGSETTYEIGGLISALLPSLETDSVRKIENAILALLQEQPSEYRKIIVKRLIKVLGRLCTSEKAKSLLIEIEAEPGQYENSPLFSIGTPSWKPVTPTDWLEKQGVDLEKKENSSLLAATTVLEEANRASGETAPKPSDLLLKMKRVESELQQASETEEKVIHWAETEIGVSATALARSWGKLEAADQQFIRRLILEASTNSLPMYEAKYHEGWKTASWSAAPRNSAAQALPWILKNCPEDKEIQNKIKSLIKDPVPTVRFLLAPELWRLRESNSEFLIEALHEYLREEANELVLGALCISLENASSLSEVRKLVQVLYQKSLTKDDLDTQSDFDYRSATIRMMIDQEMRSQESWPTEAFASWERNPLQYAREIQLASARFCQWCGPKVDKKFIEKAIQHLVNLLDPSLNALRNLTRQGKLADTDIKKSTNRLFRMIDNIVLKMYFACNFDPKFADHDPETANRSNEEKLQSFKNCLPILQLLASYGGDEAGFMVPSTAHHFMELLRGALEHGADVKIILGMAFKVAQGGEKLNYALDPMAVRETVKLAEVVVADHRQEITSDGESMRALLGLLDIFARAGWPEALKMIWRLDELYR